jgi:mannose-6-phosphate isomerase-like protein (cupin superfamily)
MGRVRRPIGGAGDNKYPRGRGIDGSARAEQDVRIDQPLGRKEASMTPTTDTPAIAPIALGPDEGEALWGFGTLAVIKSTGATTGGRVAVIDNLAPRGAAASRPPSRGRVVHVIEGELTLWVGGDVIKAPAGSFVYGPRDVPHTFLVSSDQARFLLVVQPAGFEEFFRAMSQPAPSLTVPPPMEPPADPSPMIAAAAEYGLEILGPPGIPA